MLLTTNEPTERSDGSPASSEGETMARKQPIYPVVGGKVAPASWTAARGQGGHQGADTTESENSGLLYDWNAISPQVVSFERPERVVLNDETLRDGLQSPSRSVSSFSTTRSGRSNDTTCGEMAFQS